MKSINTNKYKRIIKFLCISMSLWIIIFSTSCSEIKSPTPEPFIGENAPPPKQEFRWSNGKMPKSFDPAMAAAAPETDIVRAIYEGLTDIDSKTLKPIPSIATKWTASSDFKTWTFQLRQDAKWTNGEKVVAQNFVESWKRLVALGEKVPQRSLLKNIVGMDSEDVMPIFAEEPSEESEVEETNKFLRQNTKSESNSITNQQNQLTNLKNASDAKDAKKVEVEPKSKSLAKFGIEAVNNFTLKITLVHPDQDFPLLVAHPLFRPVFGDGKVFENKELSADIVTNGAFRISAIAKDGITLERSQIYWNKYAVKLETVKFVPTENAESALSAYRAGHLDAVTNANFQPLALKLLQPFKKEFQQTIHGALNFYEFNLQQKPFDDSRVRKALAISIEREHLTQDEMDGTTEPALSFLPFEDEKNKLEQSVEKARKLLAQAGFPNGENFPTIKLVINRNNIQQKIAKSVAQMWQKNL
ncbi:MAG: peptide ABC transporter substrate-binding protein, partial [Acidobacteriota bacterium]